LFRRCQRFRFQDLLPDVGVWHSSSTIDLIMAWSIDRIEKELLLCEAGVVAMPADLVAAVNRIEQTLGDGWIDSEVSAAKGIAPAMRVIGMGLRLSEFCGLPGPQRAELVNGMGFLFLNHVEIGKLAVCEVPQLASTPTIGVTVFFSDPAGGGGPHHQVSVRIPFTDDRAEEILKTEAKQLPKDGSGLVMINVSPSPKETPVWVSLVERRFQPKIHTRVSGVCVFSGGMVPVRNQYDWLLQTKLLLNQHAQIQLPDWIKNAIVSAGKTFERAFESMSSTVNEPTTPPA
jgi:hypothetical protein